MLELNDNIVTITRGDSAYITLSIIKEDGSLYEFAEGDYIRGQVRKGKSRDSELIFDCTFSGETEEGAKIWVISPSDTDGVEPGRYYYDMQLVKFSGDVFTFIPVSEFIISADITE